MSVTLQNRSEILFVYEVKDANPNGDPLDENKPRTDPDTGVATVTDVRIKRTIRDYWHENLGLEILVRDTFDPEGFLNEGKGRANSFLPQEGPFKNVLEAEALIQTAVLNKCIDARVFGCTLPVEVEVQRKAKATAQAAAKAKESKVAQVQREKGSVTLTGPVQFSGFNRSLHQVAPSYIQGTAAFASSPGSRQKSFREDYILPYACIAAYGVANEVAAKKTGMTDDDFEKVLQGLWGGTENLITRSKIGHQPLLLLHIEYKDGYRIGDLAGRVCLCAHDEKQDTELRDVRDYSLDLSGLLAAVKQAGQKVARKRYRLDSRLNVVGEKSNSIDFAKLGWSSL